MPQPQQPIGNKMLKTAIQKHIDQLNTSSLVELLNHLDPNQSEFIYQEGKLYQLTLVEATGYDPNTKSATLVDPEEPLDSVWQTGYSPLTEDVVGLFDGVEKICWYKGEGRDNKYNIAGPSRLPGERQSGADIVDPPSKWRELAEGEYHDPKWSVDPAPNPPRPLHQSGAPSIRNVLVTVEGEEYEGWCQASTGDWRYDHPEDGCVENEHTPFVVTSWRELEDE